MNTFCVGVSLAAPGKWGGHWGRSRSRIFAPIRWRPEPGEPHTIARNRARQLSRREMLRDLAAVWWRCASQPFRF